MFSNLILPNCLVISIIPISKVVSLIRFIIIAFIPALFACIRVSQKFIRRYEHIPTPSHPINNSRILFLVTNNIIKNVNKERYPINRLV